jgi:hypothetical protein
VADVLHGVAVQLDTDRPPLDLGEEPRPDRARDGLAGVVLQPDAYPPDLAVRAFQGHEQGALAQVDVGSLDHGVHDLGHDSALLPFSVIE